MEKRIKKLAKTTAGFALLPVGVALLVLPGPGIPVVVASLMLLEDEYAWAGQARNRLGQMARRGTEWMKRAAG